MVARNAWARKRLEPQKTPAALKAAAGIRAAVDRFFGDVMVMDKDEKRRNNRLALVVKTAVLLRQLGDPMRVAAAPRKEL